MNLRNTRLVFRREICDQWRDRRTLFTIVVMPLVLYPLMGMAMLQTAQFLRHDPPRVLWINDNSDAAALAVIRDVSTGQSDSPNEFIIVPADQADPAITERFRNVADIDDHEHDKRELEQTMKASGFDLIIRTLPAFHPVIAANNEPAQTPNIENTFALPLNIQLFANSASDQSAMAATKMTRAIDRWKGATLRQRLTELNVNPESLVSIKLQTTDVAATSTRKAAMWAKILPFIVLVWALTGAFYPAIDLCAGEKERGTLETLLCSPARRSEIVTGKLLTVITFSMATAVLNLLSMTATGLFVMGRLTSAAGGLPFDVGVPPLTAIPWLIVGLVPISALFSCLALALASFARSSREGQYYLIPLLMSLLPLMMLSMLPSAQLDLGTSLIPVTGMLLLLRNLMLGEYGVSIQYAGPVLAITLVCCWLSARWAVYQFNNESVLFRSGEQFGIAVWLRHLVRDRGLLPTVGEAALCGVLILVIKFFVGLSAEMAVTFGGFAKQVIISQVATIALPAILMALFLTRGPMESLKLSWPRFSFVPACILMAILLNPGFMLIGQVVMYLYPASAGLESVQTIVSQILTDAPGPLAIIAVIAIVPAICEEVAFRGFILSGFQSIRGRWTAILASALLFGIAHGILQQSIMAALVGIVLGIISVQTRSLLPCIAYHATHNALPVLLSMFPNQAVDGSWLSLFLHSDPTGNVGYTMFASLVMPVAGLVLLVWLWRFAETKQGENEPVMFGNAVTA